MRFGTLQIPLLALAYLPFIVAYFQLNAFLAICITLSIYIFWWTSYTKSVLFPSKTWTLHSIPPSHFCEKVRWSLEYCGMPFKEEFDMGLFGVFLLGRSVPILRIPKDRISLGNSKDILAYLAGITAGDSTYHPKVKLTSKKHSIWRKLRIGTNWF